MGDRKNQIKVAGRKVGEVEGKSGANQVRAKVAKKVVEGRAAQSTRRLRAGGRPHESSSDVSNTVTEFHFDLVRFFRATLAPCLPRAVRVFLDRCAIVLFRRAARDAFFMFRFAAVRCFPVVTISLAKAARHSLFCPPRAG
jgi:hypothetical protein